jgi:fatty acid desaturase
MKQDSWLFLAVFGVWAALAIVYATVPMFAMPGYAVVWGWGALVFLGLALAVHRAAKRKAGDTQSMSRGDADVVG